MSISDVVRQYENDFHYMIHNNYNEETVTRHFYEYRRHLDQYEILQRPVPDNNFKTINREWKDYVEHRKNRRM